MKTEEEKLVTKITVNRPLSEFSDDGLDSLWSAADLASDDELKEKINKECMRRAGL